MYPDYLDPAQIRVIGYSGPNPLTWPVAVELLGIMHTSGQDDPNGIRPLFHRDEMNERFPDVRAFPTDPRTGQPNPPYEGWIQFTAWPVVRMPSGEWVTFPAIEFWSDRNGAPRIGTGALVNNWHNWCYWIARGPEPNIGLAAPAIGQPFGFFLTSGDRRMMDVGVVRVRTNVWFGTLEWGPCPATAPTVPAPPEPPPIQPHPDPVPVPAPVPTPTPDLPPSDLERLARLLMEGFTDITAELAKIRQVLERLESRF